MRMQDGPTVEVEVWVETTPDRAWELVTDLTLVGEWSPEYQGGRWHEGSDGPAVGAWFKGRNKRGDREWESGARPDVRLVGQRCRQPRRDVAFRPAARG